MRKLVLILVMVLSLSGTMIATATPAAATGGACGGVSWFDDPGYSYLNGDYKSSTGSNFYDFAHGNTHLNFDIQSWRLTGTGGGFISGHCYRRVRISVWTDNHSYGTLWMHIRVWANQNGQCVQLVYDYWPPGQGNVNSSEWKSPWFDYSGCGGPNADGWGFGSDPNWSYYPSSVPYAYANL